MKSILPVVAAVLMGILGTACDREEAIESVNTRVMEATIYRNQWNDDGSDYLWKTFDWDAITPEVLAYGTVTGYVYDGARQCPLPHILPISYQLTSGGIEFVPENLRFDMEPGKITFIMQDLDGGMPYDIQTDLTFRVVATVPVQYVLD